MHRLCFFILILFPFYHYATEGVSSYLIQADTKEERLSKEGKAIMERSLQLASLYELKEGENFKDITALVLASQELSDTSRDNILAYHRRIILFFYPSDEFKVKGFISYTPEFEGQPLLVLLRGGNNMFGLFSPGVDLANYKNYTVISTTYRGGVSEGKDEFGGAEVADIKNLFDFIPKIEKHLNIEFKPKKTYMLGCSRGGFEMFLALARFPELQNKVDKIVALSSVLDLRQLMKDRPDMKEMFMNEFGLVEGHQGEQWINTRDPLLKIPQIKKSLPILLMQGASDIRVDSVESYHVLSKLEENGSSVTYWEIENADHCLYDLKDRMKLISSWLELDGHTSLISNLLKQEFWIKPLQSKL